MPPPSPPEAGSAPVTRWLEGACAGPAPWGAWLRLWVTHYDVAQPIAQALHRHGPAALSPLPSDWTGLTALLQALPTTHHGAVLRGLVEVDGGGGSTGGGVARLFAVVAALHHQTAPEAGPLGAAIDLLSDARAVLLDPVGPSDEVAANGPLLAALRGRATDAIDAATAGRLCGAPRLTRLRATLGSPALLVQLDAVAAAATAPFRADHPELAAAWDRGWARCRSAATMTAWIARARGEDPTASPTAAERAADRAAAIAWIDADPSHRRSWEHQRWGLAGSDTPKVGRDYVSMVILRALVAAGVESALPRLAAVVHGLPAAPLRYYGAWDGIPPDCDSLGLALLCARQTGAATPAQRAAWLRPLRPSLGPDCALPVWFDRGPDGPTCPEPRWQFGGGQCGASRAMALRGLLAHAADDPADPYGDVLDANLADVVQGVVHGGAAASVYYAAPTAARIVAALVAEVTQARPTTRGLATARSSIDTLCDRARAEQRPDGGWGTPQATAERLRLLAGASLARVAADRGLRYLSERQRPDGSWASEPFFLTLGKPPFPTHAHEGTELTTALCLVGIDAATRTLAEP